MAELLHTKEELVIANMRQRLVKLNRILEICKKNYTSYILKVQGEYHQWKKT